MGSLTRGVFFLLALQVPGGWCRYLRPRPAGQGHKYMDENSDGQRFMDESSDVRVVRYSDLKTRYTALRDSSLKACFITEYDPEWNLQSIERRHIMTQREPKMYQSREEVMRLQSLVGDIISSLCRYHSVYWTVPIPRTGRGHQIGRAHHIAAIPPPQRLPMPFRNPHNTEPIGRIHSKRKRPVVEPEKLFQATPKLRIELYGQRPQPRKSKVQVQEPSKMYQALPQLKKDLLHMKPEPRRAHHDVIEPPRHANQETPKLKGSM